MAGLKPESLNWLDQLAVLRAQPPAASRSELKKVLNCGNGQITILRQLEACFDLEAQTKVRQAAQDPLPSATTAAEQSNTGNTLSGTGQSVASRQMPFILSSNSALALAGLKKADLPDFSMTFHIALDFVLSHRLKPAPIEALVEWMLKGNSPESFQETETGKKDKSDKGADKDKSQLSPAALPEDLKEVVEWSAKAEAEIARGDGQTTAQDKLRVLLKKVAGENRKEEDSDKKGKSGKKSKSSSGSPSGWFWERLLGVKFVSQLRSKAKKGELTTTDKVLVLLYFVVGKPLEFIFEHLGKWFKGLAKDFGHWLKHTLGKTFSQIIQWAVPLLIICAIIWGAGKVYQYAIVNPLHWMEAKVKSGFQGGDHPDEQPTPVPLLPSIASSQTPLKEIEPVPHKKEKSKPVVVYQPAVSFAPTAYDPKLLEQETASMPVNCIVKEFPVSPDETMPGDVAESRMQDLTNPDKYTMMIGGGKQTVLSVTATNTALTIHSKSTDLFGVLGMGDNNGVMNTLWEDVRVIHVDEIDIPGKVPAVIYQCSLIADGAKNPLTFQCARAEDLEHLVSTLEYFVRNSRLAHDAQPAGLPYLQQGLVFNNQGLVEKLWAGSPADKAGVNLGDMIWSLDQNTQVPQERGYLEKGLRSFTPGPHYLFVVSRADLDKAQMALHSGQTGSFDPKRHKVLLTI